MYSDFPALDFFSQGKKTQKPLMYSPRQREQPRPRDGRATDHRARCPPEHPHLHTEATYALWAYGIVVRQRTDTWEVRAKWKGFSPSFSLVLSLRGNAWLRPHELASRTQLDSEFGF